MNVAQLKLFVFSGFLIPKVAKVQGFCVLGLFFFLFFPESIPVFLFSTVS